MANIKNLVQQLANRNEEIYSKIGKTININIEERTIDVELYETGSILYDVRLTAAPKGVPGNYTVPAMNSDVIVTFLDVNNAYVSLIANAEYTQTEIVDEDGNIVTSFKYGMANNQRYVHINSKNVNITTHNGGSISVIEKDGQDHFIVNGQKQIKLIVDDYSQVVINQDGINATVPNDSSQKILIGNDVTTLKTIFNSLIDSMSSATFIATSGSAVYNSTTVADLNALKTRVNALFE